MWVVFSFINATECLCNENCYSGNVKVWALRSQRICTTWSRRPWLCGSTLRETARTRTQSSASFLSRAESTVWLATTSAPRSSHPPGNSKHVCTFLVLPHFFGQCVLGVLVSWIHMTWLLFSLVLQRVRHRQYTRGLDEGTEVHLFGGKLASDN